MAGKRKSKTPTQTKTPNTRSTTRVNKGLQIDVMTYHVTAFPTLVYRAIISEIGTDIQNYSEVTESKAYQNNECIRGFLKVYDPHLRLYRLFASCAKRVHLKTPTMKSSLDCNLAWYFSAIRTLFTDDVKDDYGVKRLDKPLTDRAIRSGKAGRSHTEGEYLVKTAINLDASVRQHLKSLEYQELKEPSLGRKIVEVQTPIPPDTLQQASAEEIATSWESLKKLVKIIDDTKLGTNELIYGSSSDAISAQGATLDVLNIEFVNLWKIIRRTYQSHHRENLARYISESAAKIRQEEEEKNGTIISAPGEQGTLITIEELSDDTDIELN